jgi:hypothetical protein
MKDIFIEVLGWIAMILVLTAFFLNTRKIVAANPALFLGMNFLSGLFMAINTALHHAYPSMVANIIWLLIAASGFQKISKTTTA